MMFTFEDAITEWIQDLPWGLKAEYEKNMYRNDEQYYCPYCKWYYPHNNWEGGCPRCGSKDIIKKCNTSQLGLFG